MARTNARFVEAHNRLVALCDKMDIGSALPSENALAAQLEVSRTVVRGVLARLDEQSIITLVGRDKIIKSRSHASDILEGPPVLLTIEELEGRFLDWILRMDVLPGTALNVAHLSQEFSVATHTLQEFFSSLSRFGIVVRRPRGGWVLNGFTVDYAVELSDFRTVLEMNSVRQLVALPATHEIWSQLDTLEQEHLALLDRIETDYHDFSRLDENFHTVINNVVSNRFIQEFQKIISLVFHYHYQWNKSDERVRNEAAIQEHLDYIGALRSRDINLAEAAASCHLSTSKQTLLTSLKANNHAT
ncbi:GntR family transcriptional regulator [Granulosicoccus antarcticus]|uniref:Putative HTH-type transcriptional regulator LgoR n=1 Tax=Granulosicoccus antarcticus IMCC3135 TaxID=1192854 RepID=A0A2Z2NKR6_9GAMM|nr:GntR family transcriptional regulator [Granulosicoccus antarcticus]ASJ72002.1 putative HTH-type transcriptional regulator LgoR [Granulosicoccus antarcticus IMCC3135]